MKTIYAFVAAVCLAVVSAAQAASSVSVNATLSPSQIALGDECRLKLVINAPSDAENIDIPHVQGLELVHIGAGRLSQIRIVNGVTSSESSFSHTYLVTALQTGEFTIPGFIVRVDGNLYQSDPVTLRVLPASMRPAAPAPSSAPTATDTTNTTPDRLAFIQLVMPKGKLYVGEKIPIQVKAYFLAGQRATYAPPSMTTDAFTVSGFNEQPAKAQEKVQGNDYTILTWDAALTAIKAGKYPVDAKLVCVVLLRRRGGGFLDDSDSLFANDPFFNRSSSLFSRFFGGGVEQKELRLASQQQWLEVDSLPANSNPAQFSGAIGHFQLQATAQPTQVSVGDPITLKIIVQGKGNFDRVTGVEAVDSEGWKTYPPRTKFSPTDPAGCEGSKTLEQVFVPEKADLKTLPLLQLTYFNPETERYETASVPPISVSVASVAGAQPAAPKEENEATAPPSTPVFSEPAPATTSSYVNKTSSQGETVPMELAPNKVYLGRLQQTLNPIAWNSWFLLVQGGLLLLLVLFSLAAGRQQELASDPDHVRLSSANKNIKAQLESMAKARDRNDAVAFFAAARRALQERLGEKWKLEPTVITIADVRERMETHHPTHAIFAMADSVAYAGKTSGKVPLDEWEDTVVRELKRLENEE